MVGLVKRRPAARKLSQLMGDDMSNVELSKMADRRLRSEDFRSEAFRRDALGREQADEMDTESSVNLQTLAQQLERRPIDEIAALVRTLTYGEMIELAEELANAQLEGSDISKNALPSVLHRWSTSRTASVEDTSSS
jgi:hypothetical protein